MKYFAAFLRMKDTARNQEFRPQHLAYLDQKQREGCIVAKGKFTDDAGGLVIYRFATIEEAKKAAENDPYISNGARSLELHEWDAKFFQ